MSKRRLKKAAYLAFDEGRLTDASTHFADLLELRPDDGALHYMRGLVHKYLADWPTSLAHNLRAIELGSDGEASQWNAAIAATALGEWMQARMRWAAVGITDFDDDAGPTQRDLGTVCVRLNAGAGGETLFAERFDIVRARLRNVPLPESGYRYGDIVLHDGARTGSRAYGDRVVPVLNVLQRLERSEFQTFTVFVTCDDEADMEALANATGPGIGCIEDWTFSIRHYCLRCSYGTPHAHGAADEPATQDEVYWESERNIGIAAQSRAAVEKVLETWTKAAPHARQVDGIEVREHPITVADDGTAWWRAPDDEED
jgi:hypothetical protein